MTTNYVFASTADGYLAATDATYSGSRNGPADSVVTNNDRGYYGQNNNGGVYTTVQTFIGFSYAAIPATDLLASVNVRLYSASQQGTGVPRDLEMRAFTWTGGGLTVADWRNPTQLSAATLQGVVPFVQGSAGKFLVAGSDELVSAVAGGTSLEQVIVSSRQRSGTWAPTNDEGGSIHSADTSGTTYDPMLTWTTVARSVLIPVAGATAQLAGGGYAEIYSTGAAGGALVLRMWDPAGASWTAALPTGVAASTYDPNVRGQQGITLVSDENDNVYVIGKAGNAENTLSCRAYLKTPGVWTWTAGTVRAAALPSYDASVNNVSAAYHAVNGGTIVVVAGHVAGTGIAGTGGNDLSYTLLNANYLRTGVENLTRASGSALGLLQPGSFSPYFGGFSNEVGTGLDVVADSSDPAAGYVVSMHRGIPIGGLGAVKLGRYALNASGDGFSSTVTQASTDYAVKDAGAKARLLAAGPGVVVSVCADQDAGYGLTVSVYQAQTSGAEMVRLGRAYLAGDTTNMPDGPAVGIAPWWDAVYSPAENSVWVYYRHASDPTKVMRTRFDLNTYQSTGVEVQVHSGAATVVGVRAPRNASVSGSCRIQVATLSGSTHSLVQIVDSFAVAPNAPILTPRTNFDATAAATLAWTFSDVNGSDAQSAYDLEIQRTDTDATVVTTGKTSSATQSRNITGGTLTNGLSYRWRVRTWDSADLDGPWSDWGTFSTSAGGVVTITDPATDNPGTLVTDEVLITWQVTGTTQASYRVILTRNDTGATVSDSGWVTSTATSLLVSGMLPGVEHTVSVQVRNAALVPSGAGTRLLTPDYGTPEIPIMNVSAVPEGGYVLISATNPISGQPDLGTIVNDMEAGITAWTGSGFTITASTEQARSGTQSLKATVSGSPFTAAVKTPSGAAIITPTERYTARAWVYLAAGSSVEMRIDWLDGGGGALSASLIGAAVPAATWTEVTVTGTAPTGAASCTYGPSLSGSPANGTVLYVDDTILTAASDRPVVTSNLVLRRRAGSADDWTVVGEMDPNGSLRDYGAPGGTPLEYRIRAVAP